MMKENDDGSNDDDDDCSDSCEYDGAGDDADDDNGRDNDGIDSCGVDCDGDGDGVATVAETGSCYDCGRMDDGEIKNGELKKPFLMIVAVWVAKVVMIIMIGGGEGGDGGDGYNDGVSCGHDADDDMNPELDDAVIYGTTVNVNEAMSSFRRFLREFRLEEHEVDAMVVDGEPYYMRVLNQINESQIFNMNIDCTHLYNFTASVDDFEDTPDNRNARDRHPTRRLYVSLNAAAAVWRVCSLIDVVLLGVCLTPLVSI